MPSQPCPTVGCRAWTAHARGQWYSLRLVADFSLQLDSTRLATHERVCNDCWNRHTNHSLPLGGRFRKPTVSRIEQLLVAADASPPPPPPPSQPSPLPPPPPPSSPQPPPPPSPAPDGSSPHRSQSMPATSQWGEGSGQQVQRAVSSCSPASPSKQLKPRRSWSFKDKQQICSEWDTALSTQQKQEVRRKWRADQIDGATIRLWKEQLNLNAASPKRVRVAKHKRKRSGAGRPAALSEEHETLIDEWVMEKRSRLLQVRVCDIQWYARGKFELRQDGRPFTGGDKWVAGFMERQSLSLRLATTNKPVTTVGMRLTQFHFRNKSAATYHSIDPLLLYNMDETSVTLDQPGMRTVDRKGAKCVPIGTTGHHCDRVAVVICVSRGGKQVTPLVIRPGGKTSRYNGVFFRETHGGVDMYVTESKKAWLNSGGMVKWLQLVYLPYVRDDQRQQLHNTLLFMDNCSVHDSVQCTATLNEQQIPHEFFPPHCTPILQPCDQNVNHLFKLEYERQWREWMEETGSRDDNVTRYGNPAAAGKATYMAWIGRALRVIDKKVIEDSWRMSCTGYKRTVFHLPSKPWKLIMDFLTRKTVLATQYTAEEAAAEALLGHLQHDRKLYTAWRDYAFPVKQKRKRRQPALGVATTSAPCKRRKSATVVSDVETETDDDKENEAPAGKEKAVRPTERDTRREQRYQVLMSELQESGSVRVLDKRVTSALWEERQTRQALSDVTNTVHTR